MRGGEHVELARLLERADTLAKRADDRAEEAAVDDARACGEAYLVAASCATEGGDERRAQEALFDAALCFERAHDHGAAPVSRGCSGSWRSPTTRGCAKLVRLRPRQYPPLVEFIGAPTHLVDDEVLSPRSVGVQRAAPPELNAVPGASP